MKITPHIWQPFPFFCCLNKLKLIILDNKKSKLKRFQVYPNGKFSITYRARNGAVNHTITYPIANANKLASKTAAKVFPNPACLPVLSPPFKLLLGLRMATLSLLRFYFMGLLDLLFSMIYYLIYFFSLLFYTFGFGWC